jgi:hypothetical protein
MVSSQINTAALWAAWGRLYPVFYDLAREFVVDIHPCADLDAAVETPGPEAFSEAQQWFALMDARIHIHHLRHFAQTSPVMTEQAVSDFLLHLLNKPQRTDNDRDKVDFLLVQLIAMRLPPTIAKGDLTLKSVSTLLQPLGVTGSATEPVFMKDLEKLVDDADVAKNLNSLFTSRIIERSREIKLACRDAFFQLSAMAAFARFGYLIRRRFFQLMQQDLNAIFEGLRELESRGVETIDCRKAQFSAEEPVGRIRMICQSWRVMFQAEYSSGQPLCLLVDLRTAVEAALAHAVKSGTHNKAAAAGASGSRNSGRQN